MKRPQSSTKLALGFVLTVINLASALLVFPAEANNAQNAQRESQSQNNPAQNEPDRGSVPGRRGGGGSRGSCPQVQAGTGLTAIVPARQAASTGLPVVYVGGITTQERPVLWFYVPYTLNANLTADFILQDASGNPIAQISSKDFAANQRSPGLVKVVLPTLRIGEQYRWFFNINCTSEVPPTTNGGIWRVAIDPSLANRLAGASPQQQADIYQRSNLVYDAVNVLAQRYHDRPTDATAVADWNALLQSMGIDPIR